MHNKKREIIKLKEAKNMRGPKRSEAIAPPSRGNTGKRLKIARVRFSLGKIPKKYMIKLNNGPEM